MGHVQSYPKHQIMQVKQCYSQVSVQKVGFALSCVLRMAPLNIPTQGYIRLNRHTV